MNDHPLAQVFAARIAAVFLFLSGPLVVALAFLRNEPEADRQLLYAIGATTSLLGVVCWFLPWGRWPKNALWSIVLAALAVKTAGNIGTGGDPYTYSIHYIVLYMWIGAAMSRRVLLLSLPLAAVSYALPVPLLGLPLSALKSAILALPASLFAGWVANLLVTRAAQAERESTARAERMASLVEVTFALVACHKEQELAHLAALAASDLYGSPRCRLLLLDAQGRLSQAAHLSWPESAGAFDARTGDLLVEAVRAPRRDLRDPTWLASLAAAAGQRAIEAIPLRGTHEGLGVLVLGFDAPSPAPDRFTVYAGRMLATQAALGFERIWLEETLRRESLSDPLTRLGNRRKAMTALEGLEPDGGVALIDLDHFKRVNDTYGHAAGDRVLRSLADFLCTSLRPPDEVFRLGGEEFLVLLPGVGEAAGDVMRRVQERWRAQGRVTTFSAGVALHRPGESPDEILARADAALYTAKRAGRDRVVLDGERATAAS